eukprot:jgi/Undpi1/2940/HiC_scaffold_14.g06317.m1
MDEVSFDFMDALDPGATAIFKDSTVQAEATTTYSSECSGTSGSYFIRFISYFSFFVCFTSSTTTDYTSHINVNNGAAYGHTTSIVEPRGPDLAEILSRLRQLTNSDLQGGQLLRGGPQSQSGQQPLSGHQSPPPSSADDNCPLPEAGGAEGAPAVGTGGALPEEKSEAGGTLEVTPAVTRRTAAAAGGLSSLERQHSLKAGTIGDARFAAAVLIRPKILISILKQGYSVLWSDADMVWLGNPLSLMPELGSNAPVDMMLQYDGLMSNKCTCFMFLNPTTMSRSLLKKWEQEIINTGSDKNQATIELNKLCEFDGAVLNPTMMPRTLPRRWEQDDNRHGLR